jgi:hypothetical protein
VDDRAILDYVDSLSESRLIYFSNCYYVKTLTHYVTLQCGWFEETKYYVGLKLNRNPSQTETLEQWVAAKNPERFRAYYVLKYPRNVELLEPEYHI